MNTTDFLTIASAVIPDRQAVIFEGQRLSYAELNERANRVANALLALGATKGDRIAFFDVNCPQYLEVYFGTAKMGGIFVPLNYRSREDELNFLLNHSEASVLFVGDRYLDLVRAARPQAPKVKHYVALNSRQRDMLYYEDWLAQASAEDVFTEIDDEDITLLLYTAGTTGRPKGVPQRHGSFASYVMGNVEPPDPEAPPEVNLLCVPLYHVAGTQALMAAIYGGRTLAIMRQFEVEEWIKTVAQEKASRSMLVPTMLKRIIDHPDFKKFDLSSLKVITYGAATMPFEVIKKAIEVMPGVRFINAFGQTETASTVCMLGPEDHIITGTEEEKKKKLFRLSASIGRPLPDVEMAVMDEQGRLLPPGEMGEIVVQGPRIMSGYWQDAEKTAQAIGADGWLHSKDMGWRDEENYFYLAGRGDDMIIRGGENISPEEVEQILQSHPKVEEAAVIGIPDPEWGQAPRAVVVLKTGAKATSEDIMEYCRQNLASFKRPRSVVFIDSLPRNPMGKVMRRVLRDQYSQP